jgi:mono/diheme cytochrome c family protein
MKKTSIILLASAVMILTLSLYSCYNDNEEELYAGTSICDTINVSYTKSVANVFANVNQGNCNSCHGGDNPTSGINIRTDTYDGVVKDITRIRKSINHESGSVAMPKEMPQLTACQLAKIDAWYHKGMPND